jgi:hypothetical protein
MVALFRNGRDLRDVRLCKEDQVEGLLVYARSGDTLHTIPEEMTHTAVDVMNTVRAQLTSGKFVPI